MELLTHSYRKKKGGILMDSTVVTAWFKEVISSILGHIIKELPVKYIIIIILFIILLLIIFRKK